MKCRPRLASDTLKYLNNNLIAGDNAFSKGHNGLTMKLRLAFLRHALYATAGRPVSSIIVSSARRINSRWLQNYRTSQLQASQDEHLKNSAVASRPPESGTIRAAKAGRSGKVWNASDEALLVQMRKERLPMSEISQALGRSEGSIHTRISILLYGTAAKQCILEGQQKGLSWQQLHVQMPLFTIQQLRSRYADLQSGEDSSRRVRGAKRQFSSEEDRRLVELRGQGMSWVKVEECFGSCSRHPLKKRYEKLVAGQSDQAGARNLQWWSESDLNKFQELVREGRHTVKQMAHILGKTSCSVRAKRNRERSERVYSRKKLWTREEDDMLLEDVAKHKISKAKAGKVLKRTVDSINGRLAWLKARREKDRGV